MKFTFDHDLHIHSILSSCAQDTTQVKENILAYARKNNLRQICLTDHFWDASVPGASAWYEPQNYDWISQVQPLPQGEDTAFLFGCETELDKHMTLGVHPDHYDRFDFIVIPTTHFHMRFAAPTEVVATTEGKIKLWLDRLEAVLNMDLPFHKVGIAHLVCPLLAVTRQNREEYLRVLDNLPAEEMERLFSKAAQLGVGIEINKEDFMFADNEADTVLRPFKVAKACGCKFYCGSDSHSQRSFDNMPQIMDRAIDLLNLQESDKFHLQ